MLYKSRVPQINSQHQTKPDKHTNTTHHRPHTTILALVQVIVRHPMHVHPFVLEQAQTKNEWYGIHNKRNMKTQQHILEEECMDKLGWTVVQTARSTDAEMIAALQAGTVVCRPSLSILPGPGSGIRTNTDTHLLTRLASTVCTRLEYLNKADMVDTDRAYLLGAVDRDKRRLHQELVSARASIDHKRKTETQKNSMRDLLAQGADDGDVTYLEELTKQIHILSTDITTLTALVNAVDVQLQ